ncbi:hypothetical protein SKAU_G00332950 [Synaphobranchus kaupii]|uniref:Uncharacterized protein n=1 Tax=Synaphobranchus kaupii TaxID=118154 RepID=A0A9Q1ELK8_SYNKA|nr:hypothetical protein SKAU_G00332950 [Synaphobranchus kaupii]
MKRVDVVVGRPCGPSRGKLTRCVSGPEIRRSQVPGRKTGTPTPKRSFTHSLFLSPEQGSRGGRQRPFLEVSLLVRPVIGLLPVCVWLGWAGLGWMVVVVVRRAGLRPCRPRQRFRAVVHLSHLTGKPAVACAQLISE